MSSPFRRIAAAYRLCRIVTTRTATTNQWQPHQLLASARLHSSREVKARGGSTFLLLTLPYALLKCQDDKSSGFLLELLGGDGDFQRLAKSEMESVLRRDAEDDAKLQKGIDYSVSRGVIPADPKLEPITKIEVSGKSADEVAKEMLDKIGDGASSGCIVILQGLSGTGKGTTVSKLSTELPKTVCWSNGNVFRSLTFLTQRHFEKVGRPFNADEVTPQLVQEMVQNLEFKKVGEEEYDIFIKADGQELRVRDIAKTKLQEPGLVKILPSVAGQTQGEVILFANKACQLMRENGMNVLLEGRAPTVAYVRSPYRFELCLDDPTIIGERRAAQRIIGKVVSEAQNCSNLTDLTWQCREACKDLSPLA